MGKPYREMKPAEAAILLARELTDSFGVEVSAMKVYDLIRTKWSRVSCLAHTIHETPVPPAAAPLPAPVTMKVCPQCYGNGHMPA